MVPLKNAEAPDEGTRKQRLPGGEVASGSDLGLTQLAAFYPKSVRVEFWGVMGSMPSEDEPSHALQGTQILV